MKPKKEKSKMGKEVVVLFLLFGIFFTLPLALATGIRPAQTTIISDNTRDYQGEFWVVNNDHREFTVGISLEGEMGRYVKLHAGELNFRSDTDALPVEFEVHLPGNVPPGESAAVIVVEENVPPSGNAISSRIVLKHKIIVQGPYPDKYLEAKLNFHDRGEEIEFVSEVTNLGRQELQQVQTIMYVNDQQQQRQVLETETAALRQRENKLLSSRLEKSLFGGGEFEVSAVTTYDGQQVEVVKNLVVGEPEVEITYFTPYFVAHRMNQYSLDLLNKWNRRVENVFVDVEVLREGQSIDQFRTKSVDIEGEMLQRIQDYLDARDQGPGEYTFTMLVNFWGLARMERREFQFQSELIEGDAALLGRELEEPTISLAGGAVAGGGRKRNSFPWGWVTAAIVAVLAGGYVLARYLRRQRYEKEDSAW